MSVFLYSSVMLDAKNSGIIQAATLGSAADITAIHTDFGGYWSADVATFASNPVVPDMFHNLLAFEVNGTTYSTQVDDAELMSQ